MSLVRSHEAHFIDGEYLVICTRSPCDRDTRLKIIQFQLLNIRWGWSSLSLLTLATSGWKLLVCLHTGLCPPWLSTWSGSLKILNYFSLYFFFKTFEEGTNWFSIILLHSVKTNQQNLVRWRKCEVIRMLLIPLLQLKSLLLVHIHTMPAFYLKLILIGFIFSKAFYPFLKNEKKCVDIHCDLDILQ